MKPKNQKFNIKPLKHIQNIIVANLKSSPIWKKKCLENQIILLYNHHVKRKDFHMIKTRALKVLDKTLFVEIDRNSLYEFMFIKNQILEYINYQLKTECISQIKYYFFSDEETSNSEK